jgi:hypothetical protein
VGWVWRDPTCQFIGRDRILRGDLEWAEALDPLQVGLDVVGMVPGFGEPADGLNGGISLLRGDRVGAALSFGSMVPFAGWGATVAKWGRRGMRLGDAGRGVRQGPAVARGLGAVPGGQMPGHAAVPTGGMRQYIGVGEEGGIANSIIEGVVSIAEQRRLARYIAKRHGTRVLLRDPVGRNAFDPTTNTIHLRHPRNNLPRGVYYEEIQHALDFHARRYEGLWPLPHPLSPSYRVENSKLHIITFKQIAKNEHGWFNLTAGQINDLLKKADDWEKSLIP